MFLLPKKALTTKLTKSTKGNTGGFVLLFFVPFVFFVVN